jgi:hypothetical protein
MVPTQNECSNQYSSHDLYYFNVTSLAPSSYSSLQPYHGAPLQDVTVPFYIGSSGKHPTQPLYLVYPLKHAIDFGLASLPFINMSISPINLER